MRPAPRKCSFGLAGVHESPCWGKTFGTCPNHASFSSRDQDALFEIQNNGVLTEEVNERLGCFSVFLIVWTNGRRH